MYSPAGACAAAYDVQAVGVLHLIEQPVRAPQAPCSSQAWLVDVPKSLKMLHAFPKSVGLLTGVLGQKITALQVSKLGHFQSEKQDFGR